MHSADHLEGGTVVHFLPYSVAMLIERVCPDWWDCAVIRRDESELCSKCRETDEPVVWMVGTD